MKCPGKGRAGVGIGWRDWHTRLKLESRRRSENTIIMAKSVSTPNLTNSGSGSLDSLGDFENSVKLYSKY